MKVCRPGIFGRDQELERERERQNHELAKEKIRVFGGEHGGDEDGLCDKMMEFFGGLDFIY